MPDIRIGIAGWTYEPWRGKFYPPGLPHARELDYASRMLRSIEINGTFYSLQTPASFARWAEQTPDDFVFSLKGGRYITHMRRLRDIEAPLANFFASGVLRLGNKLGPFLWQFPPNLKFDADKFEGFFKLLPRTMGEAAALAKDRDGMLAAKRVWAKVEEGVDPKRKVRHAVEIRHESFRTPEFIELLQKHDIAIVVADTAGKWPQIEDVTASDFVYVRLHGDEELYVSGYTDEALDAWAAKIRAWSRGGAPSDAKLAGEKKRPARKAGRDVFVYFDNDVKVCAPGDARKLAERLNVPAKPMSDEELARLMEKARKDKSASKAPKVESARKSWPAVRRPKG